MLAARGARRLVARAGVGALAAVCTTPALCEAPGGRLLATPLAAMIPPTASRPIVKEEIAADEGGTVIVAGQKRTLASWLAQLLAFAIDQLMDTAFRSLNQWLWTSAEDPSKTDFYGRTFVELSYEALKLVVWFQPDTNGQTPGQFLTGIQTVNSDGPPAGPIDWQMWLKMCGAFQVTQVVSVVLGNWFYPPNWPGTEQQEKEYQQFQEQVMTPCLHYWLNLSPIVVPQFMWGDPLKRTLINRVSGAVVVNK